MTHVRSFKPVPADPGVTRQVLADAPDLMVVSFTFEEGAKGTLHSSRATASTEFKHTLPQRRDRRGRRVLSRRRSWAISFPLRSPQGQIFIAFTFE